MGVILVNNANIKSELAPEPVGAYTHARIEGNLIFLAGMGPRKKGNKEIPGVILSNTGQIVSYNIAEQTHSVFENINTVLKDCGSSWEKIIDVTVFLTNMDSDFKIFNEIWKKYFNDPSNLPTRTTVEVNKLPTPIAIELKVIAKLL